jgi:hypothetical protein
MILPPDKWFNVQQTPPRRTVLAVPGREWITGRFEHQNPNLLLQPVHQYKNLVVEV